MLVKQYIYHINSQYNFHAYRGIEGKCPRNRRQVPMSSHNSKRGSASSHCICRISHQQQCHGDKEIFGQQPRSSSLSPSPSLSTLSSAVQCWLMLPAYNYDCQRIHPEGVTPWGVRSRQDKGDGEVISHIKFITSVPRPTPRTAIPTIKDCLIWRKFNKWVQWESSKVKRRTIHLRWW